MGKRHKRRKHGFLKIILAVFLIFFAAGLVFMMVSGYGKKIISMKVEADQLVDESTAETFVPSQTGTIYDKDGKAISKLVADKNASYVSYDNIPEYFVRAMVSIEDKKFYSHGGVDYKAIARAFVAMFKNGEVTQGGSTITMQVAKNVFLTNSRTWERKIEEIFISYDLEKKYSKNEIMEYYLNNIYFANGYYGIAAACKGYFNCELSELDLSEIAFLCAIPNSPTYYDPLVNPDHTITRRDLILKNMLEDGYITQVEYNQAVSEDIVLNRPAQSTTDTNYVDTYTYHCATEALMELQGFEFRYSFDNDSQRAVYEENYDSLYEECQAQLYSGGYKIYTSFDMNQQEKLQTAIDNELSEFTDTGDDGVYSMQAAGVCIDNETGRVTAIVGGRSQDILTGHTFNRAYQSKRQPGSAIKPLLVYAPAFDAGYTLDSRVEDEYFQGGPKNSGGSYYGNISIKEAIERSSNTVAWKLLDELTPAKGLSYLENMHFSSLVGEDETSAVSIGGFTNGLIPVEMTAGFATLENDGMYREPTCIVSIVDYSGNTIYESGQSEAQIYETNSARMTTEALEGVLDSSIGTGYGLSLDNMAAAGKTGTTNDSKDGWFVGYTPYYTTGIWVGCDTPTAVDGLYGSSYPGEIWQTYMNEIHSGLSYKEFSKPESHSYSSEDYDSEEEVTETPEATATETPETTPSESVTPEADNSSDGDDSDDDGWYDDNSDSDSDDDDDLDPSEFDNYDSDDYGYDDSAARGE